MIKVAGKPSADPAQEKLRQAKKLWNKEVSSFIDDVIHFKKMVNGQPSKFFKEKSTIKDPIPADPVTIIGVLSNDFNDLAQKASAITQQQVLYSKSRRKKQPKQVASPSAASTNTSMPTTSPATDLSKQLSASVQEFELLALASNPISRFFTRILNPAIGGSQAARIRKYRMSLLNSSADIYKNLKKMQAEVVGSSPESIFISSKLFSRVEENWNFLMKGFDTFKESMPDSILGGTIANPNRSKPVDEIDAIIDDYKKYISNFLDIDHKPLHNLIFKLVSAKKEPNYNDNSEEIIKLKKDIVDEYKKIISILNNKYSITGKSLKDIFDLKLSGEKKAVAQMEKVAQDFLKKWYGKVRHQLSPLDKTSAIRLDIYKLVSELMSIIDKIMNSLEKEMSISNLEPLIKMVNEKMLLTRRMLNALEATLRGQDFDKSFMKMLEKGDVVEHGRSLSDKERAKLETALERRRMTDLSKLYFGGTR